MATQGFMGKDIRRINKGLKKLSLEFPDICDKLLSEMTIRVFLDLKENTPVNDNNFDYIEKGKLKESWRYFKSGQLEYTIENPEKYILLVEYGLNKLSDDPVKASKSMAFLIANGVFTKFGNFLVYNYQPNEKVKANGFIRDILKYWGDKIVEIGKEYIMVEASKAYHEGAK